MSKAVLISIKPEWVGKILNGEKIMEFRKTIPNCELPCKYYIYATKPVGKVVGEFTLNYWYKFGLEVENNGVHYVDTNDWQRYFEPKMSIASIKRGCVPLDKLRKYLNGKDGYALYIDDLKKYDQPKELSEFNLPECEKSECACENCKHLEVINTPYAYETNCVKPRKLTKAPQSWCYVEELGAK